MKLMREYFDTKLVFEYLPQLLSQLHITLLIVLCATLTGILFGMILAIIRLNKFPVLSQAAAVYISFMRGTPIIVQMFIVYYGLPLLLMQIGIDINRWDKLFFVVLAYGLNNAAFMSEIVRSSIASVNIGQTEAAYSIGMTKLQTLFRIVVPQAVITALPALGTTIVLLLHESSLAFSLGIVDVMGKVQIIGARTYHTMEGYMGAAIIFLILGTALEKGFAVIEGRDIFKNHRCR